MSIQKVGLDDTKGEDELESIVTVPMDELQVSFYILNSTIHLDRPIFYFW